LLESEESGAIGGGVVGHGAGWRSVDSAAGHRGSTAATRSR
jgi:hypothetical protein